MQYPPALLPAAYDALAADISGPTLRIRLLRREDISRLDVAFAEDDLWHWQGKQPASLQETAQWVEDALAQAQARSEIPFVVETPRGELVGTTRFMDLRWPDAGVEIGWTMVFSPFRRTRANTETKYLLLRRAFENVGCARVQLKTDVLNERSRHAIVRIGAIFEGIFRCHKRRANGTLRDTAYYSILCSEWPEVKARLERILRS